MQEDQRGVKEVEEEQHKQQLRVRQQAQSHLLPGLEPRHTLDNLNKSQITFCFPASRLLLMSRK
jgi:hypothetical protein